MKEERLWGLMDRSCVEGNVVERELQKKRHEKTRKRRGFHGSQHGKERR